MPILDGERPLIGAKREIHRSSLEGDTLACGVDPLCCRDDVRAVLLRPDDRLVESAIWLHLKHVRHGRGGR